ncbi:hypothetical protein [Alloalcanivorax mobilis]|uniref:hypothetical protein n=1 Tax=Alloalcanivorax mobilis TaxID=2019569 RepID=UPI000C77B7A4|nr:hypothetical protein [Alloalcanivorax mobilis]
MRLPRDNELPASLIPLTRLQFFHGLMVVAVATAIWLPAPDVAQHWLALPAQLTAVYLLLLTGLYAGSELARGASTLMPAVMLLALAALITPFLPALAATLLMALAVMMLFAMEKVAAIRDHWPPAWQKGRRQHMQFQMVSLASVVFWLISQDNQALIQRALE